MLACRPLESVEKPMLEQLTASVPAGIQPATRGGLGPKSLPLGNRPVLKQQAMPVPAGIVPVCTMHLSVSNKLLTLPFS
jgi:hypothetical protein